MKIIEEALKSGRTNLSEKESKEILMAYGIPVTKEVLVDSQKELVQALGHIDFPLVIKGCHSDLSHKTERNLVRLDIRNPMEATAIFNEIFDEVHAEGGSVLVQEMVQGRRELAAGMVRDEQFGPCVMFGLGGIFTEILHDISFRVAPLDKKYALQLARSIHSKKILYASRGMPAADMDQLADILINIGRIGMEQEKIQEIDINPLIINGNTFVAVDALVVLNPQ